MGKKRLQPIDERVGQIVRELHKKYPNLGHSGIEKLLEDQKIYVDSSELRAFLKSKKMKAASTVRWENTSDVNSAFGAGITKKGKLF